MDDEFVPAPANSRIYHPNALILYGVKLNSEADHCSIIAGQTDFHLRSQLFHREKGQYVAMTKDDYSVVLTYGYSFEGHCYRLDSHRIFLIIGAADEEAVGCGFDLPLNSPVNARYRMWRIRSSTELMEIATNFGDARTLILDANLPGKRSPNSYAIHLMMAHRNGRLTRD
jgi:hypothetical protein